MSLINLKMTNSDKEQLQNPEAVEADTYPYGSVINLEPDLVERLGIGDLEAGQQVNIRAEAFISGVNMDKGEGDSPNTRISIQMTDLEVAPKTDDREKAERIYNTNNI